GRRGRGRGRAGAAGPARRARRARARRAPGPGPGRREPRGERRGASAGRPGRGARPDRPRRDRGGGRVKAPQQPTAQEVKALRERTGAGMMDCKAALIEAGGDIEAAVDILRAKGAADAAKRADRAANEGYIDAYIHMGRV